MTHMQPETSVYSIETEICDLRIQAEENQRDLNGRYYQRNFTRITNSERVTDEGMGSFFLRTSLSLLIFCGFLWLQRENRTILGVSPDIVTEVISQSIVAEDVKLPDSTIER